MEIPRIVLLIVIMIVSAALILFFAREFLGNLLSSEGPVFGLFTESKEIQQQLTGDLFKSFK